MIAFDSCVVLVVALAASPPPPTAPAASVDGAAIISEVWSLVNDHFFDASFGDVDWTGALARHRESAAQAQSLDALAQAVNAMLAELDASHTSFHTRDEHAYYDLLDIYRQALGDDLKRVFPDGVVRYEGIGIRTIEKDGRTFIADIFEGGPARQRDLRVGDEIVTVDGERFHPLRSFRGKTGKIIELLIQRGPDVSSRAEVNVSPVMIVPHEMYLDSLRHSACVFKRAGGARVGYVRVRSFAGEEQYAALCDALQTPEFAAAGALVLDLRGGWGGANPEYLNLFNVNVPALTLTGREGEARVIDPVWRKPVALLVDGGTRSGKEVLAFAFKSHGLGPVIGARTAGAVLGGKPFLVAGGAGFLTVAAYDVRVDEQRLEGAGVAPDVLVAFDVRYAGGVDPQRERAVEIMAERIRAERSRKQ